MVKTSHSQSNRPRWDLWIRELEPPCGNKVFTCSNKVQTKILCHATKNWYSKINKLTIFFKKGCELDQAFCINRYMHTDSYGKILNIALYITLYWTVYNI